MLNAVSAWLRVLVSCGCHCTLRAACACITLVLYADDCVGGGCVRQALVVAAQRGGQAALLRNPYLQLEALLQLGALPLDISGT